MPEDRKKIQNKIIDIAKPNDKKREDYRYKRVYSKKYGIDTENDLQTEVREQVTKAICGFEELGKETSYKIAAKLKMGHSSRHELCPIFNGDKRVR